MSNTACTHTHTHTHTHTRAHHCFIAGIADSLSGQPIADDTQQRFVVHRTTNFGSSNNRQMQFTQKKEPKPQDFSDAQVRAEDNDFNRSRWSDETAIAAEDSPEQQKNQQHATHFADSNFIASENSPGRANETDLLAPKAVQSKLMSASTSESVATKQPTSTQDHSHKGRGRSVAGALHSRSDASHRDMTDNPDHDPANNPPDNSANTPDHHPSKITRDSLAPGVITLRQSLQELQNIAEKRRSSQKPTRPLPPAKHDVYDLLRQREELQKQLAEAGPAFNERSKELQLDMRALNIILAATTAENTPNQLSDTDMSTAKGEEWVTWARDRLHSRKFLHQNSGAVAQTLRNLQSRQSDQPQPPNSGENLARKGAPLLMTTLKLRRQYAAFTKWKSVIAHEAFRSAVS